MKHPTTRMIFSYWDSLRGERSAPERGEIEPGEIRQVLADTVLLELTGERVAHVRLAGTRLCAFFCRELRGSPFAQLWTEEAADDLRQALDIVTGEAAGLVAGLTASTDGGAAVDFEMILLPLRHRGNQHCRILGSIAPALVPSWLGFDPVARFRMGSLRVLRPSPCGEVGFGRSDDPPEERRRRFAVHSGGRA
jgi:hypothetical protein